MKKQTALILVVALVLAMAVPVLADTTTEISGTYEEVEVAVSIPSEGTFVINPYELPVSVSSQRQELGKLTTAGPISCQPMIAYNYGEIEFKANATVTYKTTGTMKVVDDAPDPKKNEAQVWLEVKQPTSGKYEYNVDRDSYETKLPIGGVPGKVVLAEFNKWTKTTAKPDSGAVALKQDGTAATQANIVDLMPTSAEADNSTAFALIRLCGAVTKAPTEQPWTDRDGLTVNVSWTFDPVVPTTP